jgi:trimethylamine---corrinoid protein Co-methyltransferase
MTNEAELTQSAAASENAGAVAPVARQRREGGRREKNEGGRSRLPEQRPFGQSRLRYAPTEVVSADEIEMIHEASLTVLDEIGMDVLDPETRSVYAAAGARVDGQRVRFDAEIILNAMKTAPSEFTLHATNPAHSLHIGGNWLAFGSVASAPNVFDRDRGRRIGNVADYRDLLRLGQMLNTVHFFGGYPVEPVDIHASVRHLDATYDALTLADKPIHVYSLGAQRNTDCIEMIRIARGIDDATLEREPSIFTIINTSSPLRLDAPMSQGVLEMSRRNQIVCITPFTLAGAMAPVTVAGALVQQNAEALAGMALTQLVRPGAPVIYGGFTSNVDMQSGAPAFGTPEFMRAAMIGGQLARRYNVPYRSSNVSAANSLDAQSAYESVFSIWGAVMGGANFLMHGAGWMEGGLHAGFEKMILDADLLGMVEAFLEPVVVDDATLALEAMRDVGPGGHFFGTQHTQDRFRTAFHKPMISDWRNFESWQEAGSPTAYDKANRLYKEMLAAYEPPPMDAARVEEMAAFVARRKEEGGVATDF